MTPETRTAPTVARSHAIVAVEPPAEIPVARPAAPAPQPPAPRKKSRWWVWLIVLAALGTAAYFLYPRFFGSAGGASQPGGPGGRGGDNRPIPVKVAKVVRRDVDLHLEGLLGTATPLRTVTVKSRVDGQINQINFTEGQHVNEGDLLALIDPRPFEVQLEQAKGQLAKDDAALANARVDLKRYEDARDAVPRIQVDTARAQVQQSEGTVQSDQAQIHNAELQITYSKITAPFGGRIGLRQADPGNIVHANDPTGIAVITQLSPIDVVFSIPQDQIPRVVDKMTPGQPALIADAYNRDMTDRIAAGTLVAIDNQVDPTTGMVRLKAEFQNDYDELFPNQFVNVRLRVERLHNAVVVPAAAVQRGPDSSFVYVVNGDDVELRNVEQGPVEGNDAVITRGLQGGETVVTDGVDKLLPGKTKVTLPGSHGGENGTTRPAGGPGGEHGDHSQGGTRGQGGDHGDATTRPAGTGHRRDAEKQGQ